MTELEYIREIIEGNPGRFSYFISKYKDMAFSIAFRIVNNREDAEEIVQDSFMRAFRSVKKFRKEAKFSTWFYRIVVNKALSQKKKLNRRAGEKSPEDIPGVNTWDIESAYRNLDQNDRAKYINAALGKLSQEDSLLLTLYYLDENSVDEISKITGISGDNVKMKLLRARKKLYYELEKLLKSEFKSLL
ncbi:MAG: RNA polymerase sigma factor [Bacteroidota bacterium]|nr:RNA polymerase sigma factor [Bacteroidota bacterium]